MFLFFCFVSCFFVFVEALKDVKMQFFKGDDVHGFEPVCRTVSIADGSAYGIGHLIAASVCHRGPGPGFFAPWIYTYITGGLKAVSKNLPNQLSSGSLYSKMYKEVTSTCSQ